VPSNRRVSYESSVVSLAGVVNLSGVGHEFFSGNMRLRSALVRDKFGTSWMILNPKPQSA
jgi:uncharacterized glyoxalase superfamily protein PhnB